MQVAITGEALWTVGPLTMPPDPAVTFDYHERGGVPAPAIDDYASWLAAFFPPRSRR